jgi:hypothetical protein
VIALVWYDKMMEIDGLRFNSSSVCCSLLNFKGISQ